MGLSGYIYVLVNPSLEGLVKIGKTTRTPTDRVAELSSATGVPTPFQLIYFAEFDDCDAAERALHASFTQRQARVSASREFFRVPIHEAVAAVIALAQASVAQPNEESGVRTIGTTNSALIQTLLDDAWSYQVGEGDHFHDLAKAISIYRNASDLGSSEACKRLGQIYRDKEAPDLAESKKWLTRGAELGSVECLGELASTFTMLGEKENAEKAWIRFYACVQDLDAIIRGRLCLDCIEHVAKQNLNADLISYVRHYEDDIALFLEKVGKRAKSEDDVERWKSMRDLVQYAFHRTPFANQVSGKIKWFNDAKAYGFITGLDGIDYFLHQSELLFTREPPTEGLSVQFQPARTVHGPIAKNVMLDL